MGSFEQECDHTVLRAEEKKVSQRRPYARRGGAGAGVDNAFLPPSSARRKH